MHVFLHLLSIFLKCGDPLEQLQAAAGRGRRLPEQAHGAAHFAGLNVEFRERHDDIDRPVAAGHALLIQPPGIRILVAAKVHQAELGIPRDEQQTAGQPSRHDRRQGHVVKRLHCALPAGTARIETGSMADCRMVNSNTPGGVAVTLRDSRGPSPATETT